MVELSRRWFLGGSIALIAAQTFIPSVSHIGNMPTIYGNGRDDDTGGLAALFSNEPVLFNKEQIGVDSHQGIEIFAGRFMVSRTIEVPKGISLKIDIKRDRPHFIGERLPDNEPFFSFMDQGAGSDFSGKAHFDTMLNHRAALVHYPTLNNTAYKHWDDNKNIGKAGTVTISKEMNT